MKHTRALWTVCVLLLLLLSCSSCNSGENYIDLYYTDGSGDKLFFDGNMYYDVDSYSSGVFGFDKWDCNSKEFKRLGKFRDDATAYGYKSADGEILIIKTVFRGSFGSTEYYFIREDYYPLDIFEVKLMSKLKINGKTICIFEDEKTPVDFNIIMETDICFPLLNDEKFTKTKNNITVFCEEFPMLSRCFDVYSDENQIQFIMIDQAYFLKIKEPIIIESLLDSEDKKR